MRRRRTVDAAMADRSARIASLRSELKEASAREAAARAARPGPQRDRDLARLTTQIKALRSNLYLLCLSGKV